MVNGRPQTMHAGGTASLTPPDWDQSNSNADPAKVAAGHKKQTANGQNQVDNTTVEQGGSVAVGGEVRVNTVFASAGFNPELVINYSTKTGYDLSKSGVYAVGGVNVVPQGPGFSATVNYAGSGDPHADWSGAFASASIGKNG